jgi:hypothetical protein
VTSVAGITGLRQLSNDKNMANAELLNIFFLHFGLFSFGVFTDLIEFIDFQTLPGLDRYELFKLFNSVKR